MKRTAVVYDADAQDYFDRWETATSSTMAPTVKGYFNTYILALKSNSIWTKFDNGDIAPLYNSTAAGQAVTIKGNNTITFNGSPTHSSTGVDWDGATQYAATDWVPSTASIHISYYAGDNVASATTRWEIGANSGSSFMGIRIRATTTNTIGYGYSATINASFANATYNGFYLYAKESNTKNYIQQNGATGATNVGTNSTAAVTQPLYFGCYNDDGSAALFSTNQCRFSSWGEAMTEAEATIFNTLTEALMDALGRGVQ